uniref:Uncharacterized protein n=1 Tax=Grammatophora oceanica TaxID=210454 RepID=A0A7S1UX12_9STRA|mmetsp:Transcript_25214/g.36905  ORF Transcript_25214/g.36905 Transcript_25214/m.36905 type:complete len:150 (+) Transcript_25214:100-549(+)|eukprot:CAMPEP_0194048344 /NCGR_PEP_ID=MMETSP0009_2-20130614/26990_1 /TAXON_ID=210454 /ORGANISM="Grammatophora oceanica, Strain CCMP 410" /LENGTH=149 /DNA_ID=CAMNT_0038694187 /DNA_START=88 /DNA_END=537 /DNA_ORIENTATION=-
MYCTTFASLLNPEYSKPAVLDDHHHQEHFETNIPLVGSTSTTSTEVSLARSYSGLLTNGDHDAFQQQCLFRHPEDSFSSCLSLISEGDDEDYDSDSSYYDENDEEEPIMIIVGIDWKVGAVTDEQRRPPEAHAKASKQTHDDSCTKKKS